MDQPDRNFVKVVRLFWKLRPLWLTHVALLANIIPAQKVCQSEKRSSLFVPVFRDEEYQDSIRYGYKNQLAGDTFNF
jgi:hypothetical protein